jgi:MHS family proline/betaine transporter-like MFS transporter
MDKHRQIVVAGAIGNTLEFYDFAVFAYLVPILGTLFFPPTDQLASILKAYALFAVGFVVRPFGGVVFGHFADRVGRKRMLQISIIVMAIPTALVGCLPTYSQIGVSAAGLLLFLRIIQGLAVGGEGISSFTFLGETAAPKTRGLYSSFGPVSGTVGFLLGSAVAFFLNSEMQTGALHDWGWRIPFLLGILPAGLGWWMRRGLPETRQFEQIRASGQIEEKPVLAVLTRMPGTVLRVTCLTLFLSTGSIMFIWMPTYLTHIVKPSVHAALLITTLTMALMIVMQAVGGAISDRLGRRTVFVASALGCALLSYPLFHWLDNATMLAAIGTEVIFAVLLGVYWGTLPAVMVEAFPTAVRVSGNALAYNSANAVSGASPLLATWLIATTGDIAAPAFYLILLGGIAFVAALGVPARHGDALR